MNITRAMYYCNICRGGLSVCDAHRRGYEQLIVLTLQSNVRRPSLFARILRWFR